MKQNKVTMHEYQGNNRLLLGMALIWSRQNHKDRTRLKLKHDRLAVDCCITSRNSDFFNGRANYTGPF